MFYLFVFLISALCSSLHASNHVFNQDTFLDANWRMEVRFLSPTSLYVRVDEGKQNLLEQTVTIGQLNSVQTPTCSLTPDHNGFNLSYVGFDGTSLRAHIDANATIDVLGSGSGIVNTGFVHSKSWGFKTPGIWRNGSDNLNAFYNLITEAKEFHNLGVLQVATGHFTQSYHFNNGVFHMGLAQSQVSINPYEQIWGELLKNKTVAGFQNGVVENYGVILAESGLSFNDYGYAHFDFLDLEDAPLNIEQEPEQKGSVSVGISQTRVPIVHVEETIVGKSPRIRVAPTSLLSVGQISSSLSVQDWTNEGLIQTIQAGLLGQILQGLREAGLDTSEIQALVDDAEIGNTLMGLAMIDSVPPSDIPALISQQTDSSRALSHFYTQASRAGMAVLSWVKQNGPELVGHLCDLANALAASGFEHPVVVGSVSVCNAGRFAKTTYSTFKKADAFFSKRHGEGKGTGGGSGISAGSGGNSSSSSSSVLGKAIVEKPFGTYKDVPYHHQNSAGVKSAAPKNGQEVLNSSVAYGNKGHRVGVDSKNKEIVVFMKDGSGTYHGHVRSWEGLEASMQKALRDAGKVRVLGSGNKIKFMETE